MILETENTIMLIIDVQEKLLNAVFNKEQVLKKSKILSATSKILNIPLIITEQYPKGLGATIEDIRMVADTALYFEKTDFNALAVDNLIEHLKKLNKKQVILFGIETHICVHQTAYALVKNGFEVFIAKDACGSRNEEEYNCALNTMEKYNVKIKTTEMMVFELLKSAKHPHFKELQALIK